MPIENRNLTNGTKLIGRYHKQSYTCEVEENAEGKLLYKLEDGREFKSPSAAGMAITGNACDGWVFWSIQTTKTAPATESTLNAEMEANTDAGTSEPETSPVITQTTVEPNQAKKRNIFRAPNQKGVLNGQTRWYCHDCGKSFLADMGVLPTTCPQGHQTS